MNEADKLARAGRTTIEGQEILSKCWGTLSRYSIDYMRKDGTHQYLKREVYDRGDGAAILLYNTVQNTVILTRQMRFPVFLRDNDGDFIEVCAGMLDGEGPVEAIRREAEEETGISLDHVEEIAALYTSPGAVTERLHLFIGSYTGAMRTGPGGGLLHEGEEIAVLELPFPEAMAMIADGRIADAKTVVLLQHVALKGLCVLNPD